VAADQVVGPPGSAPYQRVEPARLGQAVVIGEGEERPSGQRSAGVARRRRPAAAGALEAEAEVRGCRPASPDDGVRSALPPSSTTTTSNRSAGYVDAASAPMHAASCRGRLNVGMTTVTWTLKS
jgi:hypothetical protein